MTSVSKERYSKAATPITSVYRISPDIKSQVCNQVGSAILNLQILVSYSKSARSSNEPLLRRRLATIKIPIGNAIAYVYEGISISTVHMPQAQSTRLEYQFDSFIICTTVHLAQSDVDLCIERLRLCGSARLEFIPSAVSPLLLTIRILAKTIIHYYSYFNEVTNKIL